MYENRSVVLRRFNGGVFDVTGYIDQIHIGNGASVTNSQFGYMRYKPNYANYHSSYLVSSSIWSISSLVPVDLGKAQSVVCLHMKKMASLKEKLSLKKLMVATTLSYLVPASIHMDLLIKDAKP